MSAKEELEAKFDEYLKEGCSLREIARLTESTYYQVQRLFIRRKEKYMTQVIHYRTLVIGANEALLRMIPYDLSAGVCSLDQALAQIETAASHQTSVPMAVELQIQPDVWINFDFDVLIGERADQIKTFYEEVSLNDFANTLAFHAYMLKQYNAWMFREALVARMKKDGQPYIYLTSKQELEQTEFGKSIAEELQAIYEEQQAKIE